MAAHRIYCITESGKDKVLALVSAANKSQALAHYAGRTLDVAVAVPGQLIVATKDGVEVEHAGEEAEAEK